jgi:hypothetical protein
MTPAEIALARRIIACGIPVPACTVANGGICATWDTAPATPAVPRASTWEVELWPGDTCRPFGTTPSAGLLFRCVATDAGPELLPALDDFALLGWLLRRLRDIRQNELLYATWDMMLNCWAVREPSRYWDRGHVSSGESEISATVKAIEWKVAALEAAKAAS